MPTKDSGQRDILGDIGRILAGVGMIAVAAANVIAAGKRGPKVDQRPGTRSLDELLRAQPRPRRRPPESGIPVPAVPPRGPLPKQGGAAAELDFEA